MTQVKVRNASKKLPLSVWVTLGATPGCLQDVGKIPWIERQIAPLMGCFVLRPGATTAPFAPKDLGFNANFSFNTPPLNCPTSGFPNGVNLFEFIVNNAFQGKNAQETVDISCVAGVNCAIRATLNGPAWNAGPAYADVKLIENGKIGTNSRRVGVYPVGCDTCTGRQHPPRCPKPLKPEKPQIEAICNVQRNAANGGGIIEVAYLGAL